MCSTIAIVYLANCLPGRRPFEFIRQFTKTILIGGLPVGACNNLLVILTQRIEKCCLYFPGQQTNNFAEIVLYLNNPFGI